MTNTLPTRRTALAATRAAIAGALTFPAQAAPSEAASPKLIELIADYKVAQEAYTKAAAIEEQLNATFKEPDTLVRISASRHVEPMKISFSEVIANMRKDALRGKDYLSPIIVEAIEDDLAEQEKIIAEQYAAYDTEHELAFEKSGMKAAIQNEELTFANLREARCKVFGFHSKSAADQRAKAGFIRKVCEGADRQLLANANNFHDSDIEALIASMEV